MNKIIAAFLILAFSCSTTFAADGDVVLTDLHGTASIGNWGPRSIVSYGGAPGGSGVAAVVNATDGDATAFWDYGMPANLKEVTVVWWERYSVWPLTWDTGGCKSIRQYNGDGNYFGALISFWNSGFFGNQNDMYVAVWVNATVWLNSTVGSARIEEASGDGWMVPQGDDVYLAPARLAWNWEGMGTQWRKMRYWIKMPTSLTSADAEQKLWIDNELHFHLYNATLKNASGTTVPFVTSIRFAPVDESATPHEHWYDEITIYEGYVPPDGEPLPDPDPEDPETPTTSGPILRTGSSLLRVGDGVLRVQ